MEESFVAALTDARAQGRVAVAATWLRAVTDIASVSVRRRLAGPSVLPRSSPRRIITMTSSDVRFAFRSFRRQPAPPLLVTAMLALRIAANIVVFSLVNGLFLRPLPCPDADRLVYINGRAPKWNLESTGINCPDYAAWRAGTSSFDGIALYQSASLTVSDAGGAERVDGAMVTHNFMDVLGVTPVMGRMFGPDEDKPGGRRVVVISEGLWR